MKLQCVPGTLFRMKGYDSILMMILRANNQTYEEAAKELGISVSTLIKMVRQRWYPNFRGNRGEQLYARIKKWSGGADPKMIWPNTIFTREFVTRPNTFEKNVPYELIMWNEKKGSIQIDFATTEQTKPVPAPALKRRRNKRKKNRN